MKIKQRVVVVAEWSSFLGWRGEVTQVAPFLMVKFDAYEHPLRIEEPSVVVDEPSTTNLTGAE